MLSYSDCGFSGFASSPVLLFFTGRKSGPSKIRPVSHRIQIVLDEPLGRGPTSAQGLGPISRDRFLGLRWHLCEPTKLPSSQDPPFLNHRRQLVLPTTC
jgi:hypothetical protein